VTSIAAGTALLMALHALRLPQPTGPLLTVPEAVRERLFSYGLAVAGILTWHGVWELWETQLAEWPPLVSGAVCHFTALAGLLALRSLRSTLAPPACVVLDDDPQYGSLVPTLLVSMKSRGIRRLWD
jgi:Fuseless